MTHDPDQDGVITPHNAAHSPPTRVFSEAEAQAALARLKAKAASQKPAVASPPQPPEPEAVEPHTEEVAINHSELAVNLWAYVDEGTRMVYAISGKAYALAGLEADKLAILRQLAATDHVTAKRQPLPKRFTITDGQQTREGMTPPRIIRDNVGDAFESVFRSIESDLPPIPDFVTGRHTLQRIPPEPLFVLTFLLEDDDGNVTPFANPELRRQLAEEQMQREALPALGLPAGNTGEAAQRPGFELLDFKGLLARLPLSEGTLRAEVKRGRIPSIRLPGARRILFDWQSVRAALLRYQRSTD